MDEGKQAINWDERARTLGGQGVPNQYDPRAAAPPPPCIEVPRPTPRPVTIVPVLNGWLVEVGCQRLVYVLWDELVRELSAYQADPAGVEQRYLTKPMRG